MIVKQIWTANAYRNFNYLIACAETGEALAVDPLDHEKCLAAAKSEEIAPDLWIVVVPDDVYRYCRPQSIVEANVRVQPQTRLTKRESDRLLVEPSLFDTLMMLGLLAAGIGLVARSLRDVQAADSESRT